MAEEAKIKILIDNANSAKNLQETRKALKEIKSELLDIGEQDENFLQLAEAAGKLQDKVGDTQATINFFADDFAKLKGSIGIVEGIAGGFAVAQGAVALFGGESEELNEVLKKTQGTIALLNGLQAINAKLNKDSYERILLQTTAQKAWNSSLVTSIRNLKGVQAAIAATGLGLIAVAVGAIVVNWDKLNNAFKETGVLGKVLISVLLPIIPAFQAITALLEKFDFINTTVKKSTADLTSELELQVKTLEAQGKKFNEIFKIKREILKLQATEIQLNIRAEKDEKKKAELQRELNKVLGDYLGLLKQKKDEEKKDADELTKKNKETADARKKLLQELIDERNKAIKDEQEREIATLKETAKRRLEEIQDNGIVEDELRKQIEENLGTDIAAIRKKYADLAEKERKEAIQKEEEERRLKNEREKTELEKINAELLLLAQNDTAAFLLEQKRKGVLSEEAIIANGEKLKELRTTEFEREINDNNLTTEQKRAIQLKYQDDILTIENDTAAKRKSIRDAELAAAGELVGALGALANQLGNQSAEAIAFQRAVALAQIGIDLAKAIGSLTANSSANPANAVTFGAAGAAQYATGLVQILSSIAQAKNILSEQANTPPPPQFATGGFVSGAGTATSDSIPAWLSNGEFVVNAKSTSVFAPLLDAMNNMTLDNSFMQARSSENGNSKNEVSPIESKQTIEVKAYVSEKEITDSQKRITKIERNGTIY